MERLHQALEWDAAGAGMAPPRCGAENARIWKKCWATCWTTRQMAASAVRIGLAVEEGDAAQPPHVVLQIEDDGWAWRPTSCRPQASAVAVLMIRFRARGWGCTLPRRWCRPTAADLSLGKSALLKGAFGARGAARGAGRAAPAQSLKGRVRAPLGLGQAVRAGCSSTSNAPRHHRWGGLAQSQHFLFAPASSAHGL